MELNIFAKKASTRDGKKTFFRYLTSLRRKDGSPVTVAVKFSKIDPIDPLECPCTIKVNKTDCNLAKRKYQKEELDNVTGEVVINEHESATLWISAFEIVGPYVDHSLDEFED